MPGGMAEHRPLERGALVGERVESEKTETRQRQLPPALDRLCTLTRRHARATLTALSAVFIAAGWLAERAEASLLSTVLYLVGFACGGYISARDGLRTLIHERELDVDLLMVLAAIGAASIGYWADGAVLIMIFALSGTLEEYAMRRTGRDITALMRLHPETAVRVREDGQEEEVPVSQLRPGDIVLVKPGERIPVDGKVVEGQSAVNQALVTGESIPVEKEVGSEVFSGTINGQGVLKVQMTVAPEDTLLSRVVRLVQEAQREQPATQKFLEAFGRRYARVVVAAAVLFALLPPFLLGWTWSDTLYRAMILLVVASPCALVASTMPAVLSAISNGARHGILFKSGMHLENLGDVKVVALDKTGTLTTGEPRVSDVIPLPGSGLDENQALALATALECRSEHPLARAVTDEARRRGLTWPDAEDVQERPGFGLAGVVEGRPSRIGSPRFLAEAGIHLDPEAQQLLRQLRRQGKTASVFAWGDKPVALVALQDTLRPEAPEMIKTLRRIGILKVVLLTGDSRESGEAFGRAAGCDEIYAELLPQDKVRMVKELTERYGPVAMVGDGINDAPALATALVGVAMGGAGSDVTLETADVVLVSDELSKIPYAIHLGRRVRRVVRQNIAFALAVIVLLVASNFLQVISLPLGVIGHEGSTILVILNGLRLLQTSSP